MKAVVFAYHNMGLVGLEALKRHRFEIRAIFSHEDDPGENCWFDPGRDQGRADAGAGDGFAAVGEEDLRNLGEKGKRGKEKRKILLVPKQALGKEGSNAGCVPRTING